MASRQRHTHSSASVKRHGREIMRPIISSDVMGNRNVEVVPVGAWVEPADDDFQPDAVRAAQIEEEKIQRLKEEKENRLRTFQHQVKQRVIQANRIKRQQQIQEAEQAFERERKVVQQSCLTGEMPRRDTCMLRQDLDKAIRKRLLEKYGEDILTWDKDTTPALQSHTEESHQVTDKARQQLMSKKISQKGTKDDLAKAGWKAKVSRTIQIPTVRSVVDVDDLPTTNSDQIEQRITDGDIDIKHSNKDIEERLEKGTQQEDKETDDYNDAENQYEEEEENAHTDGELEGKPKVQFSERAKSATHRHKKRPRSPRRPKSAQLAVILSHDTENDILARQRRQQAAVSRRIFMDREREAVRENIRRQQHRKKIKSLKREKEEYRQELEELAHKQLEPTDPITGETAAEKKMRERMENLQVKEMVDRRKDEIRRAREMERYLDALRHSLKEKVMRAGIQLPSMCACGDTVWDTHPETCANNCFFYRNPRAYARALQSMLSSSEVM